MTWVTERTPNPLSETVVGWHGRHFMRQAGTILARGVAKCAHDVRACSQSAQFSEDD